MESMRIVNPVKPVAPYIGGKNRLAAKIVKLIESVPHRTYAEGFVGMGGIFFRRTRVPAVEVINDYSRDVSNLFRILQRHYPQFIDTLKYQLSSRTDFNRLMDTNPETLTDLERAARFLYLQRTAFGGKVSGKNFGVSPGRTARFDLSRLEPMLEDVYQRLSGVTIEALDYKEFLRRYDTPETLFYLDPPYYGCEKDYGKALFTRAEFPQMAEALKGIKGRFILSLNDRPEVRDIFKGFRLTAVDTTYSIAGRGNAKKAGELLISNLKGD